MVFVIVFYADCATSPSFKYIALILLQCDKLSKCLSEETKRFNAFRCLSIDILTKSAATGVCADSLKTVL